jgi:HSP20 family protein
MASLMTLSPFSMLSGLLDEINTPAPHRTSSASFEPAVDIVEHEQNYILSMDIPGVDSSAIDISVDKGVLTIKGSRTLSHQHAEQKSERYSHRERRGGAWSRSFKLPESVDAEAIAASAELGVLQLTLPKAPKALARRVEVVVK